MCPPNARQEVPRPARDDGSGRSPREGSSSRTPGSPREGGSSQTPDRSFLDKRGVNNGLPWGESILGLLTASGGVARYCCGFCIAGEQPPVGGRSPRRSVFRCWSSICLCRSNHRSRQAARQSAFRRGAQIIEPRQVIFLGVAAAFHSREAMPRFGGLSNIVRDLCGGRCRRVFNKTIAQGSAAADAVCAMRLDRSRKLTRRV